MRKKIAIFVLVDLKEKYLAHISGIRRYSPRTVKLYRDSLESFAGFAREIPDSLNAATVREWEIHLLEECSMSATTVGMHLSILSGFCRYLMSQGLLDSNPVRMVKRPKTPKRLPTFYREESMREYFDSHRGTLEFGDYAPALRYMIVSLLYSTGLRRAELIGLDRKSFDPSRKVLHVLGKGDKMRDIPLCETTIGEISLYLRRVETELDAPEDGPLLLTPSGTRLYPMFIERAVKRELDEVSGISVRKSPHVLRHTIASELLDSGSDLNSIKELLGHSSLAATQVYTHNSIEKLKKVYTEAHPRAKKQ